MKKFIIIAGITILLVGCTEATKPSPLGQIPKTETILAYEKILPSDNLIVITKPVLSDPLEMAQAKIWFINEDEKNLKLLKEHTFQSTDLGRIDFKWENDLENYILDIQFQDELDQLGGGTEFTHDYIDIEFEKVLATSSWTSGFAPVFWLETAEGKYNIQLQAKDNCSPNLKKFTDIATGLLINNLAVKFVKPHPIACAVIAEGEAVPLMPGLEAPYFHDGNMVSFQLPWETIVDINLEKKTTHSVDFAKDYELP